jgi:hypothetical protein
MIDFKVVSILITREKAWSKMSMIKKNKKQLYCTLRDVCCEYGVMDMVDN